MMSEVHHIVRHEILLHTVSVPFGVPQGSALGPHLFVLYAGELSEVVAARGLMLHQYADDCQIYIATPVSDASSAVIDCRNVSAKSTPGSVPVAGTESQEDRSDVARIETASRQAGCSASHGCVKSSHCQQPCARLERYY